MQYCCSLPLIPASFIGGFLVQSFLRLSCHSREGGNLSFSLAHSHEYPHHDNSTRTVRRKYHRRAIDITPWLLYHCSCNYLQQR